MKNQKLETLCDKISTNAPSSDPIPPNLAPTSIRQ